MRTSPRPGVRALVTAGLAAALLLALPSRPAAHEIPADVTVQAFVAPQGDVLRLLVRVPLTSMRDVEFPVRGPGYLDLDATRPLLDDLARLWIADYVRVRADGEDLGEGEVVATRISLPSSQAFRTFETALRHVRDDAPLPSTVDLVPEQALLDVLLEYPIASPRADFTVAPAWAHLGIRTETVLRFVPPGAGERVFRYEGDPGEVRLDPRWHHAAWTFTRMGFLHILEGIDHLLFVFCLVIPFRSLAGLVPVVTAFTVAHSITLVASAFGLAPNALWFPPLVETLIALSIVWMALENMVGASLQRRWIVAFGFGLVHGFGFSFLLRDSLQFAGGHMVTSLLAFNVGVELGQIVVLVAAIPVLEWLFRRVVAERVGTLILSALIAHTAWHWMTERGSAFLAHELALPAWDAALAASLMRWLMLALVSVGAAWLLAGVFGWFGRRRARQLERKAAAEPG